jgi:error-prone DNA polymerase
VYAMIMGFSGFGFPKAHGAAFGLLAYQSTWLRVHYGPEFLCALLNEQPMGFYAPDTLAHEAQGRGIELIAPDVNLSGEECTVDADGRIRLGLNYVLGARSAEVAALVAAREEGGPFRSLTDLASRAGAGRAILDRLAWAGACDALAAADVAAEAAPSVTRSSPSPSRARRTALWRLGVAAPGTPLGEDTQLALPLDLPGAPALDPIAAWDTMVADYATTGLTLGPHPVALLRPELPADAVSTRDLEAMAHDTPVTIGGLVVARQRPGTAKGIVFLLFEDEFGTINLIVPPPVYERHRLAVRTEPLLLAWGKLEKLPMAGGALNVYVRGLRPLAAPATVGAEVVALPERGAPADAVPERGEPAHALSERGAPARARSALGAPDEAAQAAAAGADAPSDGALADFRGVAPAVQSFAAGRRR